MIRLKIKNIIMYGAGVRERTPESKTAIRFGKKKGLVAEYEKNSAIGRADP